MIHTSDERLGPIDAALSSLVEPVNHGIAKIWLKPHVWAALQREYADVAKSFGLEQGEVRFNYRGVPVKRLRK